MSDELPPLDLDPELCILIFTVSAAMIGVCLTAIGLIHVNISIRKVKTVADDMLAGDALLFLTSCFLSYWALRSRSRVRMHRVERVADGIFLVALAFLVMVCMFLVYEMS